VLIISAPDIILIPKYVSKAQLNEAPIGTISPRYGRHGVALSERRDPLPRLALISRVSR